MTGRDVDSFGFAIFVLGVLVAVGGPFLSGGKGSEGKTSFNWYVLGGLAMVAGACIMYR